MSQGHEDTTDPSARTDGPGSRRHFLRRGATTAAGVAAGAVLANANPAEAANGDAVKIGQFNTGTAETTLSGSKFKTSHTLAGVTAITGESTGDNGMGVLGLGPGTTPNGIGVKGQGKTGVVGDGNYPGGIGVSGYGPTGVKGESPANTGAGVEGKATGPNSTGVSGTGTSVGVFGEGGLIGVSAFSVTGDAISALTEASDKNGVTAVGGFNGAGVYASATGPSSSGVAGISDGTGVFGEGTLFGVAAFSSTGEALNAHTDGFGKAAVHAVSVDGPGVHIDAVHGPALRIDEGPAIPPATLTWNEGDIVRNHGLWLCIVGGVGSQSKWVKLSRVYQPLAAPIRIYDSRPGYDPAGVQKGKTTGGAERVIEATVGGAVPAGIASAVEVNVTVDDTTGKGWLSLFANGVSWPGTSTINWFMDGMTIANGATVAVDAAARFRVRSAGSTHVVIDVTGYYT